MRLTNRYKVASASFFSILGILLFQNCNNAFRTNFASTNKPVSLSSTTTTPTETTKNVISCGKNEVFSYGRCVNNDPANISNIDPVKVLPTPQVLAPKGTYYVDEIPASLDLASRAELYIQGAIRSLRRDTLEPPMYVELFGDAHFVGTPGVYNNGGNWGKSGHALIVARLMSGFDADDRQGTLTGQLYTLRNMFDPKKGLIQTDPLAPEALMYLFKMYPSIELQTAIEQMLSVIRARVERNRVTQKGMEMESFMDTSYYTNQWIIENFERNPRDIQSSELYTRALFDSLWATGKLTRSFSTWNMITNEPTALASARKMGQYVRHFNDDVYWNTALPVGMPAGYGHFSGHGHTYIQALTGLAWLAEALLRKDPNDPFAKEILNFANAGYKFERDLFGLGVLGNFSEICELSSMIRLALKLTDLGVADYYEDVDRWTRNSLAEAQIMDSDMISNRPSGDDYYNNIGSRVVGLFYEDNSHPMAIPTDSSSLNFFLVACGLGNAMISMYEVWDHIIQIVGSSARINMPLNRTSREFDVLSELPWSGRVRIKTKATLGTITEILFRVPDWTKKDSVNVKVNGQDSQWYWVDSGPYIRIPSVKPSTEYVVYIPMITHIQTITQMQDQNTRWNEWNIPAFLIGQTYIRYNGRFRGNTLVDTDWRPSEGKQRYLRREWALLPDNVDVAATYVRKTRFALGGEPPSYLYFTHFTGNKTADLITQKAPDGNLVLHPNTAGQLGLSASINGTLPTSTYEVAFSDITGDGKSDLIGRHYSTGDIKVWPSGGRTITGSSFSFGNLPVDTYDVRYADVNGDGKSDLVGRHRGNGEIHVWSSGDSGFSSFFSFGNLPGNNWEIYLADVTGDKKADLIGRNRVTGEIYAWESSGGTGFNAYFSLGHLPNNYEMYLADMNGDGKSDLIARRMDTGEVFIWASSMTGNQFNDHFTLCNLSIDYEIKFADIDGDNKADLLSRNLKTGEIFSRTSTGKGLAAAKKLGQIP